MNFINLHIKFNLKHFKAFYCRIEASSVCICCQFRGRLIKFGIEDFKNVFELEYKGMEICVTNAPNFNHTQFVKMASETFVKDHSDTNNFHIS